MPKKNRKEKISFRIVGKRVLSNVKKFKNDYYRLISKHLKLFF